MINFLTTGQLEMQTAAFYIWQKKWIKFVEVPHGAGLGHALADLTRTSSHVKVVHVDCLKKRSIRDVSIEILRHATNVKFSNLSHLSISIDRLLLVVKDRLREDLRHQKLLLVIDHIDILDRQQLYRLVDLLKFRQPPCGILLRSTTEHRLKLATKETHLHDALYINLPNQAAAMIQMTTRDERKIFARDVHAITDEGFIKDLSKPIWGFTKLMKFIADYKAKGGK
jgi:hypothetical protein